jgi:hypothetical protein
MGQQAQKQQNTISPQPDSENKREGTELKEVELKKVTGVHISEWTVSTYLRRIFSFVAYFLNRH